MSPDQFNNTSESGNALTCRPAYAHGQSFWRKIRAGQEDVFLFVNSDSTWNASEEPFYRWVSEVLAPACATHTIVYRIYLDGSGWTAPATVQIGSGARKIYIDNAAIPGSGLAYINGAKEAEIFAENRAYDLAIVNHGHNFGFSLTESQIYPLMMVSMASLMALCPGADIFVTLQNPWLAHLGYSRGTQGVWRKIANMLGLGIIDVASRFEALGDLNDPAIGGVGGPIDLTYYDQDGQGGLHPKVPTGVDVALTVLTDALAEGVPTGSATILRSPFEGFGENLMQNPKYADWSGSVPVGHSFSNVTPAKSVAFVEKGLYGMSLTCGAGVSPTKQVDLTGALPIAKKRWLTYVARVWVPAGMSTTAGRLQLLTTGASNRSASSLSLTVGKGGWSWVMVCHQILDSDTSIKANLLCGAADGSSSGGVMYVDREIVLLGQIPADIDPASMEGAFANDLYNERQVRVPAGFTGTASVNGNDVSVSGATAPLWARAYANFLTVPGRIYRVGWGNRNFVGTGGLTMSARGPYGAGGAFNVTTTSGSPNLTGITANLAAGQPISGAGIPNGTTLLSIGSGTAVMSANATASGTISATISTGSIGNNGSFIFGATGSMHSLSINGGSNVTDFTVNDITITELYSGIANTIWLAATSARNGNGSVVDVGGSAGNFKIAGTLGSALYLQGEDAQGIVRTNAAVWEAVLPSTYIAGRGIFTTVNASYTGTGVVGTRTIDVRAYKVANDGTLGADICLTAAQPLGSSATDHVFLIAGTSLSAGDRVQIVVEASVQETSSANSLHTLVNSVRLS